MEPKKVIELLIEQAASLLPSGAKLILFGSRAKGSARNDSDWDLLILLDKERRTLNDIDEYALPFRELGWEINQEINPIVATYKEVSSRIKTIPLYTNITNEGITLWENHIKL